MPSSAKQFLPFIRQKFPKLAKQYEQWYTNDGYAPEEYRKKISDPVRKIREKFGFATRPLEGTRPTTRPAQMTLGSDTRRDQPASTRHAVDERASPCALLLYSWTRRLAVSRVSLDDGPTKIL